MIRDPSDGTVRTGRPTLSDLKAKYGENWGLKSLDEPPRNPKPAPTIDELREHYAKHDLGFKPKTEEI
jgi:hypothetical protein